MTGHRRPETTESQLTGTIIDVNSRIARVFRGLESAGSHLFADPSQKLEALTLADRIIR